MHPHTVHCFQNNKLWPEGSVEQQEKGLRVWKQGGTEKGLAPTAEQAEEQHEGGMDWNERDHMMWEARQADIWPPEESQRA